MIVVRELWARGFVPSSTSINKNNKYYGNMLGKNSIYPSSTGRNINLYINEALLYKKMHE